MTLPDQPGDSSAAEAAKPAEVKPSQSERTDYAALLGVDAPADIPDADADTPKGHETLDVEAELGKSWRQKTEEVVRAAFDQEDAIEQGREEYRRVRDEAERTPLVPAYGPHSSGVMVSPFTNLGQSMNDFHSSLNRKLDGQDANGVTDPVRRHELAQQRLETTNKAATLTARVIGQTREAIAQGDWESATKRIRDFQLAYGGIEPGTLGGDLIEIARRYQETGSDDDRRIAVKMTEILRLYPDRPYGSDTPDQLLQRIAEATADAVAWQKEQEAQAAREKAEQADREAAERRIQYRTESSMQGGRGVARQVLQFRGSATEGRRPDQRADSPIGTWGLSDGSGSGAYDQIVQRLPNPDGSYHKAIYTPTEYLDRMETVLDGLAFPEGQTAQYLREQFDRIRTWRETMDDGEANQLREDMQESVRAHLMGFAQEVLERELQWDTFGHYDTRRQVPFGGTDIAMAIRAFNAASPTRLAENIAVMDQLKAVIVARKENAIRIRDARMKNAGESEAEADAYVRNSPYFVDLGPIIVKELGNADIRHADRVQKQTAAHETFVAEQEAETARKTAEEQAERDRVAQEQAHETARVEAEAAERAREAEREKLAEELRRLEQRLLSTKTHIGGVMGFGKKPNPDHAELTGQRERLQTQLKGLQPQEDR